MRVFSVRFYFITTPSEYSYSDS